MSLVHRVIYFLLFLCGMLVYPSLPVSGQNELDRLLSLDDYMGLVMNYHPLMAQANLQPDFGDAALQGARGAFDPMLGASLDEKKFKGSDYYRLLQGGVRIPTWFGITANAGFEDNSGQFLNPEGNTPVEGLLDVGLEANLLQGLIIDSRRAALRKAKIYQEVTDNERQMMINDLILDAMLAYINWQTTVESARIIEQSIALAQTYLEATKDAFQNGDKPAIDTLEAYIIVQDRTLIQQQNNQYLVQARQELENYLWLDGVPLELADEAYPDSLDPDQLAFVESTDIDDIVRLQPEIVEKELKIRMYEIDRRLKTDKLKPKLSVKYNALVDRSQPFFERVSTSDYKWGFKFSFPLLLRSERADITKTNLKIQQTEWELVDKQNVLKNKLEATFQKIDMLVAQGQTQDQNVDNYRRLLEAELTKFGLGESSVFLLNKREEKYLDTRIKRVKTYSKLLMSRLQYLYYSNSIEQYVNDLLE